MWLTMRICFDRVFRHIVNELKIIIYIYIPLISGQCVEARSQHASGHVLNVLTFENEYVENEL